MEEFTKTEEGKNREYIRYMVGHRKTLSQKSRKNPNQTNRQKTQKNKHSTVAAGQKKLSSWRHYLGLLLWRGRQSGRVFMSLCWPVWGSVIVCWCRCPWGSGIWTFHSLVTLFEEVMEHLGLLEEPCRLSVYSLTPLPVHPLCFVWTCDLSASCSNHSPPYTSIPHGPNYRL